MNLIDPDKEKVNIHISKTDVVNLKAMDAFRNLAVKAVEFYLRTAREQRREE